ncbi:MAG: LemA family protein [Brevinematales bacterium]|nr:LemA family protein [Brevinematales bacterium]
MQFNKSWIFIAIIVVLVLGGCSIFMGGYNRLVTLEEQVKAQWSQVENVYQRRADLIPNLVETVKGYAKHERETLQAIVEARSRVGSIKLDSSVVNDSKKLAEFQRAQGELSGALSRLMVVVENYPQLKANENFLNLQSQLEGTENRIAVERKRYNELVQEFNSLRRRIPTNIIASLFGFSEKAYFKAEEGAEKAPKVKFE